MKFGVGYFPTDEGIDPVALAQMVEQRGFESLFFTDHTHIPASRETAYPAGGELPREYSRSHDPFVALMAAAAATQTLMVGTGDVRGEAPASADGERVACGDRASAGGEDAAEDRRGVGEHLVRRLLVDVSREHARSGTDGDAPARGGVSDRERLDRTEQLGRACLTASERRRHAQPVEARGRDLAATPRSSHRAGNETETTRSHTESSKVHAGNPMEDDVKPKLFVVAMIAASALALAGAASADDWRGDGVAAKDATASKDEIKLKLKRSPYGKVLFADGFALYLFTADGGSGSVCKGECAEAWPPLAAGKVAAGKGVRSRLLGTTTRDDGSEQLTYAGKPLYFYVHDPRGEVYCNDVFEFGGDWFAVKKSGKPA